MNQQKLLEELQFKTSRSSGPGGQHANKTESRVTVIFNLMASQAVTQAEKELLLAKLSSQLNQNGELQLSCEESRSQHKNKEIVTQRLLELLTKNLIVPKKRIKRKPSKIARLKRLEKKKRQAQKKLNRKKPRLDD